MADFTGTEPLVMKRHDTAPPLIIDLTDGPDGLPVSLAGASRVRVLGVGAATIDADTADRNTAGSVTYQWQAADTGTVGVIAFEVEVTAGGKVQTYPRDGFLFVCIVPDNA
jgi:hypothetical protein